MENGGFNEDGGLWIEDMQSRFEDSIIQHQHLIYSIGNFYLNLYFIKIEA